MPRKNIIIIGNNAALIETIGGIAQSLDCTVVAYPTIQLAKKAISPASIVIFLSQNSHDFIELSEATRFKAPVIVISKNPAIRDEVKLYSFRRLLLEENVVEKLPKLIQQMQFTQAVLITHQKDVLLPKVMDELARMCLAVSRISYMKWAITIAKPEDTIIVIVVKRASQLKTIQRLNTAKCQVIAIADENMKAAVEKIGGLFIDRRVFAESES